MVISAKQWNNARCHFRWVITRRFKDTECMGLNGLPAFEIILCIMNWTPANTKSTFWTAVFSHSEIFLSHLFFLLHFWIKSQYEALFILPTFYKQLLITFSTKERKSETGNVGDVKGNEGGSQEEEIVEEKVYKWKLLPAVSADCIQQGMGKWAANEPSKLCLQRFKRCSGGKGRLRESFKESKSRKVEEAYTGYRVAQKLWTKVSSELLLSFFL